MVFAIKAIEPKKMKNIAGVRLTLLNALRNEGAEMRKDFEETVSNWDGDKPSFPDKISLSGGDAQVSVEPSGSAEGIKKWNILNEGAKAHIIRPRRAKRLRFNSTGFRAKTKPGTLKTGSGSKARPPTIYSLGVRHPGIKARSWSKIISANSQQRFTDKVTVAIREGALKLYG